MKAVILAGGLGTRLREETEYRPKPMVEIGGKPILWHIMKFYSHYGIRDFIICAGYRGNDIKEYFLNYDAFNNDFTINLGGGSAIEFHGEHLESRWRVTIVDTGLETNTGGRVKQIERFIDEDDFLVTYGDGLADVNLPSLVRMHRTHGRVATVTTVQPTTRFGILEVADDGTVLSFREKPRGDDWVSAGFFVFNRRIFDYLQGDLILEQEPLQRLTKDGELMAYRHHGFWQPMDTYREFLLLQDLWNRGERPWKVWP
ncbi:MAG TPA: glucose-1-phosphate cytidylyltransferase [Acidimicrobiia bacterium]|nr:glucose-1-phosphate cytidylyltransferase [Acidimicrobiia bacterium]